MSVTAISLDSRFYSFNLQQKSCQQTIAIQTLSALPESNDCLALKVELISLNILRKERSVFARNARYPMIRHSQSLQASTSLPRILLHDTALLILFAANFGSGFISGSAPTAPTIFHAGKAAVSSVT
ncbi:MAG: hypothetical protein EDM05_64580 [Leptolyngbya sp. IPPAS B-1204]